LFQLSTTITTPVEGGAGGGRGVASDEKLRASDTLLRIAKLNREKRMGTNLEDQDEREARCVHSSLSLSWASKSTLTFLLFGM
jgi:hypothetical protein